jgi:hypothetical protein
MKSSLSKTTENDGPANKEQRKELCTKREKALHGHGDGHWVFTMV